MGLLAVILITASAVLIVLLLRARIKLLRRIAALIERCEAAELERSQLKQVLLSRDHQEIERVARLEHDLRSSISGVVGFSSLLREFLEKNPEQQSPLIMKSASAIHQSATRTLMILDAAGAGEPTPHKPGLATKESDRSSRGDIREFNHR